MEKSNISKFVFFFDKIVLSLYPFEYRSVAKLIEWFKTEAGKYSMHQLLIVIRYFVL